MGRVGKSKEIALYWRIRPKISRVRQTLTDSVPSHPKAILDHENIRVSFLWTTLWRVLKSLASRLAPTAWWKRNRARETAIGKMPDSL